MTDGMDLATTAVNVVAQAAGAAATAAGGAIGGTAVELVRRRLSGIGRGEEAVRAVEESPEDPDARSRLRERLSEVLSEDQAFAAELTRALRPPKPVDTPTNVNSIVIDKGSKAKGKFLIGNQTVTKIRKGDPWALVAVVAVVAVMALLIYGIVRLAAADDGPPSADSGHSVTALKDSATVKAVVPDLHSMPSGWTSSETTSLTTAPAACGTDITEDQCAKLLSVAEAAFDNPYDQTAGFVVLAWRSADDAQSFYDIITREARKETGATQVAMPAFGDQSIAFEHKDDNSNKSGLAMVQVGTVLIEVSEGDKADYFGTYELDTLQALTRMVAERAQEAQDGQTPSAAAQQ
ncbi:hypothetical protein ACIBCP_16220 [Streptomyces sp. NPDC051287]|uniref:hypothetical protein n=1 Tax=Streptomyces sp. NPDC051287 TaxID=3365648 RepID=UPI0037A644C5